MNPGRIWEELIYKLIIITRTIIYSLKIRLISVWLNDLVILLYAI